MTRWSVRETLGDMVNPAHTALLVIDVQNDLCPPSYEPTIVRLSSLLTAARKAGVFIVYVQNSVVPGLTNSQSEIARREKLGLRVDVTLFGSEGERFVKAIAPLEEDVVVRKHRLNAFEGTDLNMLLRNRGIETIVCTGVATHGCVTGTSYAAQGMDYYVVVVEDCVDSWQKDLHQASLLVLRNTMNDVTSSDKLVDLWSSATAVTSS
jgi:ureidoacrylate peracid hydrolase